MRLKRFGLIAAGVLPVLQLVFFQFGDDPVIARMAAIALMMSILWITEAVPLAVTALLPLVLFPVLGISSSRAVAAQYMNSTVFLLIGGFMLALAMQRWNLHKRIALTVLALFGSNPRRLMIGFSIAAASLSMWISNTATTLMMLPIALAILNRFESVVAKADLQRLALGLLLAIAYSASIGGMMTPVGTAPNLVFMRLYEIGRGASESLGFAQWMLVGVPVGTLMLTIVIGYLNLRCLRNMPVCAEISGVVREELKKLGPMRYEERVVMAVFAATALLWISRQGIQLGDLNLPGWQGLFPTGKLVDDGSVAIAMSLLLFLIPARHNDGARTQILTEDVFLKLPWPVVVLFGGGFALASGFVESGLSAYLAAQLQGLGEAGLFAMIFSVTAGMSLLTELTSNTATTQLVLPILRSVADMLAISPLWLMLPATLSASCAFMFPVATPPNAIIFGSGRIALLDMLKVGVILNLAGIVVISLVTWFAVPVLS